MHLLSTSLSLLCMVGISCVHSQRDSAESDHSNDSLDSNTVISWKNLSNSEISKYGYSSYNDLPNNSGYGLYRSNIGNITLSSNNGSIHLSPPLSSSRDNNEWFGLQWHRIVEIDTSNNTIESIDEFNHMSWLAPQYVTYNISNVMVNATLIQYNGSIINNMNTTLTMSVYIFNDNITIPNGNQSLYITYNSIKFDIDISNWPFKSINNSLVIGLLVSSSNNNQTANINHNVTNYIDPKTQTELRSCNIGVGQLQAPTNVFIDGVQYNNATHMTVNHTAENDDQNIHLIWQFPAFQHTLHYDPVLTTDTSTSTTTTLTGNAYTINTSYNIIFATLILAIISMIM